MNCKRCGCYFPSTFKRCPACDSHKRMTKAEQDTVSFRFHGIEYTCQVTTMQENKDGSVSFRMKTIKEWKSK